MLILPQEEPQKYRALNKDSILCALGAFARNFLVDLRSRRISNPTLDDTQISFLRVNLFQDGPDFFAVGDRLMFLQHLAGLCRECGSELIIAQNTL
jgi:hypothetical protein